MSGGDGSSADPFGAFASSLGNIAGSALGGAFSGALNPSSGGGAAQAIDNITQQPADSTAPITAADLVAGTQAPTQSQSQNQQGQSDQKNQSNAQIAQNTLDALKKALTKPKRQPGNPWVPGGPPPVQAQPLPINGQPAPTSAQAANLPSADAQPMMLNNLGEAAGGLQSGEGFAIPPGEGESYHPEYGDYQNPRQYPYNSEGESIQAEYGPGQPPPPQLPSPDGPTGAGQLVPRGNTQPAPYQAPLEGEVIPPGGGQAPPVEPPEPRNPIPPVGGLNLSGLARQALPWAGGPVGRAIVQMLTGATPAETGELPPGGFTAKPGTTIAGPASEVQREGEGGPAQDKPADPPSPAKGTTTAPATGKKIKTVDPKTNKPVNPQTGAPLPEKGGEYQPATGNARDKTWRPNAAPTESAQTPRMNAFRAEAEGPPLQYADGHGSIMRDVSGRSTGVPQLLGELAKIGIPLAILGLTGRHGRHRGGFGWQRGQPGAFQYPGPRQPSLLQTGALISLLSGLGGQQQNQQQQRQPGPYGPGNHFGGGQDGAPQQAQQQQSASDNSTLGEGPWSGHPFLESVVGSESGGRNVSVIDTDGQWARGIYQFHDETWRRQAKLVPGASQYPRADLAPPEIQQAVALVTPFNQWGDNTRAAAHRKFGNFNENLTIGQLSGQFGGPGTTKTGGSTTPNPSGNQIAYQ